MKFSIRFAILAFLMLPAFYSISQTHTPKPGVSICSGSNGFYEYLPQGYWDNPNEKFPVILFLTGIGELGNGTTDLNKVLTNGTPRQINVGIFPNSFTVNGETFKFIVITPQFTSGMWSGNITECFNYIETHYKVDINRVYLTGLSLGGGACWAYAGTSKTYAERIAALIPCAGAQGPNLSYALNMAAGNLPVLATHNDNDPSVPLSYTNYFVDHINAAPVPPTPLARRIIFHPSIPLHEASWTTYDLDLNANGQYNDSMNGKRNVYEWMLQFKRNFNIVPVNFTAFNATKNQSQTLLQWSTRNEVNSLGFSVERSKDNRNWTSIGFVNSNGSNGGNYSFTDPAPGRGKIFYRIKQQDNNGDYKLSEIRLVDFGSKGNILIYPNPVVNDIRINTDVLFVNARLNIYNTQGQLVKQVTLNGTGTLVIPFNYMAKGNYVAEIIEDNKIEKLRFIKN